MPFRIGGVRVVPAPRRGFSGDHEQPPAGDRFHSARAGGKAGHLVAPQASGMHLGWDGDKDSSRDGWIETEPLAIGTGWRPTQDAQVRLTVQTNYPSIVSTGAHSKAFYTPSIYVRHSPDRAHWSDWQPTALDENPRAPGKVLYTASVGVARRMSKDYEDRHQQWARREDVAWGSDEDAFCRWLVKQEPDYFAKQRPFVGYVQFLLESSFHGNQRLTRFEADVDWTVSGLQQLAKGPTSEKRLESQNGWGFRGDEATLRKKE